MADLDVAHEAGRAGGYAILGGILLKITESILRRAGRRHKDALEEIDATINTGAALREELRRENDSLRKRLETAEAELVQINKNLVTVEHLLSIEETARQDAEAEIRLLKRAQRTPIPPSGKSNREDP